MHQALLDVADAISMAVARRGDAVECILHSDRSSQHGTQKAPRRLGYHGLGGSTGLAGPAGDSAAMGTFFTLPYTVQNARRVSNFLTPEPTNTPINVAQALADL